MGEVLLTSFTALQPKGSVNFQIVIYFIVSLLYISKEVLPLKAQINVVVGFWLVHIFNNAKCQKLKSSFIKQAIWNLSSQSQVDMSNSKK